MCSSGASTEHDHCTMPTCIFIRDMRYPCGGFETWVEQMAEGLPAWGIATVTLLIAGPAASLALPQTLEHVRVLRVPAADEPLEQARIILTALEDLAREGLSGVFFTGGYAYIDLVGINLGHSPWLRIPVMHGRHASAYDWTCLGPPRRVIAPAADLTRIIRNEMRSRIGLLRTLGKVSFIPHGVPLPPGDNTRRVAQAGAPLTIAVVSRLHEDLKRPFDYVWIAEALACLGIDFRMTIVGDGPAKDGMETLVRQLQLAECVRFTGALPRTEVYEILGSSDVLIQTSESEAFGLAIAEALACGCAVIAADIPGEVARMVNRDTGIRVPVGDIHGFLNALVLLRADPAKRCAFGEAGRRLVRARYSSDHMLERYSSILRKLGASVLPQPGWRCSPSLFETPGQAVGPGLRTHLKSRLASLFARSGRPSKLTS
jgi:glycosyltransferase involved in cell wall biosynthesis